MGLSTVRRGSLAVFVAAGLVLASCGGDDDDAASASTGQPTTTSDSAADTADSSGSVATIAPQATVPPASTASPAAGGDTTLPPASTAAPAAVGAGVLPTDCAGAEAFVEQLMTKQDNFLKLDVGDQADLGQVSVVIFDKCPADDGFWERPDVVVFMAVP